MLFYEIYMETRLLLILLLITSFCFSQEKHPRAEIDSPLNFFGQKPIDLQPYNNRVVPFNAVNPLYVQTNYEDGKTKKNEYFRIDSINYLVYEFFRNNEQSSIDGIKSRGVMRVTNEIAGTSTTTRYRGIEENNYTLEIHHYRALTKEGEWEEFEDSVFHHIYWTGNYRNNKKVGLWKHMVYGIGDNFLLEEIDYSKDSTKKILSDNLVNTLSLDSLKSMLIGRWQLRSCDEEKDFRMFYSKWNISDDYQGGAGSDYGDYYDFISLTNFTRKRSESCNEFREKNTGGQWSVMQINGQRYIEIIFSNGEVWKLKILYLDHANNLITDRQ